MTTGILIEPCAVLEKDVQEMFGGNQFLEEKPNRLLDRKRLSALGREDDSVLGFDPVDPLLHTTTRTLPAGDGFLGKARPAGREGG